MDVEGTIQSVVEGLAEAWNRQDWPSFSRWFAQDADDVTGAGVRWAGRDQILKELSARVEASTQGQASLAVDSVKLAQPDVAVVLCSWEMSSPESVGAGHDARAGVLTMVLRQEANGWRIVTLHNTNRAGH
jgi:uncharacterized protein (TIGR02246 family)